MDYKKYYKKSSVGESRGKVENRQPIESIRDKKEVEKVDQLIYILLLISILIIPIYVKAHIAEFISPHLTFMGSGMQVDIFSYYKYVFLIIITVLLGILFLYKALFLRYDIQKSKSNFFLAILAVVVTLSAVFSPYKSLALYGMFNRHEGTLTYICYLIIFFIAVNVKYSTKQLHGLLYALYPFVIINMILGLSLFNGSNLLEVSWIKNLIVGSIPEGAQVNANAQLWATVSNPNYISGIGAVLTILFLTWAIFDENKIRTGINVIVATLSFVMVLTSFSTSGFLTIIVLLSIIFILIFFNERKVKSIVILLAFVILATSVYIPMATKNPRVWNETFGFVIKENPFVKQQTSISNPNFFVLGENLNKKNNLAQMKTGSDLNFNKNVIEKGLPSFFLPAKAYAEENSYAEDTGKFEIPTLPAPSVSAGTGRAYIWEKTFDTAMKCPILGYGLDTFTYVFPQNDIDKVAGLNTYNVVVDKPHNMYLGLLIGSGIIALLAFILLVGSILLKGIKVILKRQGSQPENVIMFTLFTTSIAYLVQGIFNDSVIGSAVIFWLLIGVLVSILNNKEAA